MSSQEQEDVPLGHVLLDEVVDGEGMDLSLLASSDHEFGEQGRLADEAMLKEEGTPKGTDAVKSAEEMEVVDNDDSANNNGQVKETKVGWSFRSKQNQDIGFDCSKEPVIKSF